MFDLDYLSDPRDRAVFASAPTLMQPSHEDLPPCPYNTHRYVAARDGLYLQARTHGLSVCKHIAPCGQGTLPYGPLSEYVRLTGGRLPRTLYDEIVAHARQALPEEWACLILYEPGHGYRLHVPSVESASGGHIRYRTETFDPEQVVVDMHTHGYGNAFFSPIDDADDQHGGVHISVVLGECDKETPSQVTRLAVHGHLLPVELALWDGG